MIRLVGVLLFCLISLSVFADEVPAYFTYQGRLLNTSGTAPLNAIVDIKFEIFNPSNTCLLYEETHLGVDLTTSAGVFSLKVGSPLGSTIRTGDDPGLTMSQVLANAGSPIRSDDSGSTNTCPSGYTPNNGDARKLRVTIVDGGIETVLTPDQVIASQPYAIVAQTLQGISPSGFVRIDSSVDLTQANLELLVSTNDASSLHHHDSLYVKKGDSVNQDLGSGNVLTTGRIGIGTSSPSADIEIERTNPTFRMDASSGSGGNSQIQFYSGSTERARIESPESTGELRIFTNGVAAITIDANQNANFSSNVRLKGFLDLGDYDNTQEGTLDTYLTGVCGSACAGSIWFNTDLGLLRYWDGSDIATLGDSSSKLSIDGSIAMTGDLDLGGNQIVNVGAPVGNTDAANKAYVDGAIGAVSTAVSGDFVDRDGSTALTGNWDVGGFDLNNLGNISIAAERTLGVGHLDNTQEGTLTGSFTAAHTGKIWYNTDTNVLKVWTGSSAQSLGVVGGSLSNLNGETGAIQNFGVPGVTGNAPNWVSSSDVHTLHIPMANTSGVTAGLISKAEFDDFNQKQNGDAQLDDIAAINPATSSGSYIYSDGTNLVTRTIADLRTDLSLGSMADETATDYLLRDGSLSMTGALNMGGHLVGNVATPLSASDATTKGYVDAAIGAISTSASGAYLTIADNLADLNNVATARANLGLGSMAEETAADYLRRDGTLSMAGALNLAGNNITSVDSIFGASAVLGNLTIAGGMVANLSSPSDSKDAANKGYVDAQIAAVSTAASGGYLAIASNLSDLNDMTAARSNLGVEIGVDVQAYDARLDDIAAINPAASSGSYIYSDGTNLVTRTVADLKTDLSLGTMADEAATDYLLRDGTLSMTGALNMEGHLINNVATPVASTDATTKAYVDAAVGAVSSSASGDYVRLDGVSTMTGNLNLGGNYLSGDGGSEGIFVDSDGDVGIGTNSPNKALTINRASGNGEFAITGANSAGIQAVGNNGYSYLSLWDVNAATDEGNKTIISDHGKLFFGKTNDAWTIETPQMTIDNSGSVGIGTSSPSSELEVVGRIASTTATLGSVSIASGMVTNLSSPSDAADAANKGYVDAQIAAVSMAASGDYLTIAGNLSDLNNVATARTNLGVEIGVDVQAYDAQLDNIAAIDPSTTNGSYVYSDGSNLVTRTVANLKSDLALGTMADETATDYLLRDGSLSMTGNLNLGGNYLSGDGDSEGIIIGNDGKVGIGAPNPTHPLHVAGSSTNRAIKIERINTAAGYSYIGANNSTPFLIDIDNGDTVPDVVVDTAGNVGIGTTAPGAKLHILDTTTRPILKIESSSTLNPRLELQESGDSGIYLEYDSTNNVGQLGHRLIGADQSPSLAFSRGTGNVGIGTTAPQAPLHVNGGAIIGTGVGAKTIGVVSFFTSESNTTKYIHIKTPFRPSVDSEMYHFKVEGYEYSAGRDIDLTYVGYSYAADPTTIRNPSSRDPLGVFNPTQYIGSDGYIYLRFKPSNVYYTSFRVDSTYVGNGRVVNPGEMTVIASASATL